MILLRTKYRKNNPMKKTNLLLLSTMMLIYSHAAMAVTVNPQKNMANTITIKKTSKIDINNQSQNAVKTTHKDIKQVSTEKPKQSNCTFATLSEPDICLNEEEWKEKSKEELYLKK